MCVCGLSSRQTPGSRVLLLLLLQVPVLLSSVLLVSTTAKVLVSRSLVSSTNVCFFCVLLLPLQMLALCAFSELHCMPSVSV